MYIVCMYHELMENVMLDVIVQVLEIRKKLNTMQGMSERKAQER